MTLKFKSVLAVVKADVRAKLQQARCSGSWVINSALHCVSEKSILLFIFVNFANSWWKSRLGSRISLERIKQSTSGKRRYQQRFFPRSIKQFGEFWQNDLDLWPWKLNRVRAINVHVQVKYHQAKCSGSWVTVCTSFFPRSRNGEKSGPVTLTVDLRFSKSLGFVSWSSYRPMFVQNFIELGAAVHELSWSQRKKTWMNSNEQSVATGRTVITEPNKTKL